MPTTGPSVSCQNRKGVKVKVHPIWQFAAITGASSAVFAHLGWIPTQCAAELVTLAGTLAQIGTTMLGFMLAALAVVASISHTHLVSMMHKTGHYKDLISRMFTGCVAFLACTLLSMVILFGYDPNPAMRALLVGLHAAALWTVLDVGHKFWLVLSNLKPGTNGP
jgi:hypothetical protein